MLPGGAAAAGVPHDALVLVDALTGMVAAVVPLRAEPLRVSYGGGAFWAVAPEGRAIVRVEPRRRDVSRTRVGVEPYDAAAGGGAVFVADHDGRNVLRVDQRTRGVRRSRDLGGPQLAIAYVYGSVWVVGADRVLRRLDPASLKVTGTVSDVAQSVEHYEPKIAVGAGSLWVSDAVRNAVVRIDPRGLRIVARHAHGGAGVTAGPAGVWTTDSFKLALRVAGGSRVAVRAGPGAVDVAEGGGAVWVVTRFAGTLVRLDPRRGRVAQTIRIGGSPIAVAFGDGEVAVAVR
jgi:DNA-binding beta-propeller fold protein YncE